jgi:hypothetical protein
VWRWLRTALAATAVVLLLLALWVPTHSHGPATVSHATVVGDAAAASRPLVRTAEAPSLLVDKDNPHVVYLADVDLASGACTFAVSTDGGATWRAEQPPRLDPYTSNCALGSAHPQNVRTDLQQGPDGTIYYAFQGNDTSAGGSRSVLLGRSTDSGRTWHTTLVDAAPPVKARADAELDFEAHVTVDPRRPKDVYVMWRRSASVDDPSVPARPNRAELSVSHDGGAIFGPPTQLLDVELGYDGPRPLVVSGVLYAFYLQASPSAPTGSSFPASSPPLARLFVAASRDEGRTWTRSEIAAARDASEPVPAYDGHHKAFYVVWHDNRRDELDVWFARSTDGVAWSAPRLLNDDPAGMRVGQHYPVMSITSGGRVDVAWYDWRDDPFPAPTVGGGNVLGTFSDRGKVASVYLTSSRDGGKTWSRNLRVNDQLIDRTVGTWANNYDVVAPPAIASTRTTAVVAWSDTRNATIVSQSQDIATAVVTFERVRPARVTSLQAAVVGVFVGLGLAMWVAVLVVRTADRPREPSRGTRRTRQPAAVS